MKKIAVFVLMVSLIAVSIIARKTPDVIRFHVKANSDSTTDQSMKLEVRDRVLALIAPVMDSARDKADAQKKLQGMLDSITACANQTLKTLGSSERATVTLGREEFPSRYYDGVRYPQGNYEALMVRIGNAEGRNWWCVAFPRLCYAAVDKKNAKKPIWPWSAPSIGKKK